MSKRFDVFGMCNALYDLQAEIQDDVLRELSLSKGSMTLISEEEQRDIVPRVYNAIVNTAAGGSGANTMIGIAQLGGKTCFTSRVGDDEHGRLYRDGLERQGVRPNLGKGDGDTGISLILVSPDAERTMCTFLGQARELQPDDVNVDDLRDSSYLYVTGYLWDTDNQKEAVLHAMQSAKAAGVKVAFSLSDPFCVGRHHDDFMRLLADHVDVVFANAEEAQQLTGITDIVAAARAMAKRAGGIAVVTQDSRGSLIVTESETHQIPAFPVTAVDTTGAGDMYAGGVLYGLTHNLPLPVAGRIGAYTAAQVVAQMGPRLAAIDREAISKMEAPTA